MHRRDYLIAAGGTTTLIWSGVVSAGEQEEESESEEEEEEWAEFIPEDYEPDPQEFEGDGSDVVEGVEIEGGLTIVQASYDGPEMGNFIVELVPEESEFSQLFQNVLEPYEGVRAAVVDADTYLLDVEAEGPWEIAIYQPRPDSGEDVPSELEGENDRVYGPFEFEGTHIAAGSHEGEGNFIVEVLPMEEMMFSELVFNEIGQIETNETTFQFDALGWVAVQADGAWEIGIE